jgi:hypothetical protein
MGMWLLSLLALAPSQATMPALSTWEKAGAREIPSSLTGPLLALEGLRSTARVEISKPLSDQKVELSVWLKGTVDQQWISIDTKAWKTENGKRIPAQCRVNVGEGYVTTEYARLTTDWKEYKKTINVSRGAETLTIKIENITRDPLYVMSPSFKAGAKELADLDGPGVIRARINVWVKPGAAKRGHISFPVPMVSENQVPLAFKFDTEPAGVVKSYRFVQRPDGMNWLCEADVEPRGASTRVSWESLVLVKDRVKPVLPLAAKPEVPEEAKPWLRRTTCVQTDAPVLIEKAAVLAQGDPDIETYVRRVIDFSCANRGTGAPFNRLDAAYAMECGGSCTSRANLAAALLRIHGIPARTVAHLPTWAYGEALFTHWLVEYWHPGAGWVPVESTWAEFEPPTSTYAALAISSPEDEDRSDNPEQVRWVMPGAAEWTMARIGASLTPDPEQNQQANWAKPERRITGSSDEIAALFAKARKVYSGMVEAKTYGTADHFHRMEAAMQKGQAVKLSQAIP